LKSIGGVAEAEKQNYIKAALLYDAIDAHDLFNGTVAKEDRSKMNVCFTMENTNLEKEFLSLCKEEGMIGVKGHRSAGGFRVSLYNAVPYESVVAITDLMNYFANKNV
jgi:phosphoserine aminotransferase